MTNKAKSTILIAISFLVFLSACDRKAFVKKIVGTWKIDKYLFSGREKTVMYDSTYRIWRLTIAEDETYTKTWEKWAFFADSIIRTDTLGYDTVNTTYLLHRDTLRFMDTIKTPFIQLGTWALINSEEDLQLRSDSSNSAEIFRILELGKSNLNLKKGNEELYLGK